MNEQLEDFLDKFRNENVSNEDSYKRTLYLPTNEPDVDEEIDFDIELDKVMQQIGIKDYAMQYCGGFDSPGYDIDCYCLAYIDLEGRLQTIPIAFESY